MKLKKVAALGMAALAAVYWEPAAEAEKVAVDRKMILSLSLFGLRRFSATMLIPLWKKGSKALRKRIM